MTLIQKISCSISSSSFDDTNSSPEQTVPHGNVRLHTMNSTPNSSASCFTFRPVRDTQEMHTTDSETSDITESTEMDTPSSTGDVFRRSTVKQTQV